MDQQTINQKAKDIQKIFQEYQVKLKALQDEQNAVISQFVKELEEKKMEEIRSKM